MEGDGKACRYVRISSRATPKACDLDTSLRRVACTIDLCIQSLLLDLIIPMLNTYLKHSTVDHEQDK